MTLRKFQPTSCSFSVGQTVFLVTRRGAIVEGCQVAKILGDLVSLVGPDLPEKQGFTIRGTLLKPNWCEGRRLYRAACLSRAHAESLASSRQDSL